MFKVYLLAMTVFFSIDMIWLGLVAKNFYGKHIGFLMADKVNWISALLFYLVYISAIVFFVINPALEKKSWMYALGAGAFFGFTAYATYDLTNLATIKNWPLGLTIADLLWGSLITSAVSVLTFILTKKFVVKLK